MKQYQTAFFDMDGTLLDTSEGILNSLEYTIRKLGLPVPDQQTLRSFIGPPLRDSVRRVYGLPQADTEPQVSGLSQADTKWRVSGLSQADTEQFVRIFRQEYEQNQICHASLYPGVLESLQRLRSNGIFTAVATNKPQEQADDLVKLSGMEHLLDAVYGCDAAGEVDKGIRIRQAMQQYGAGANGVLAGDTASDAYGAAAGGVDLIGVLYGFGFSDEKDAAAAGAVFAARSFADAVDYILGTYEMDQAKGLRRAL